MYYTQVLGLGESPEGTVFRGAESGVHQAILPKDMQDQNSIIFWRGVENLTNAPSTKKTIWSVSQAAPLRRVSVEGDLQLGTVKDTQGSGGFCAGVKVGQRGVLRGGRNNFGFGFHEATAVQQEIHTDVVLHITLASLLDNSRDKVFLRTLGIITVLHG